MMAGRRRRERVARSLTDVDSVTASSPGGPDRGHPTLGTWTGWDESMALQAGPFAGIVGERRLDDATALVARRPQDLLEQRVGHAVRVVIGIDDDQVDDSDEAARPDRGTEGEDRTSDHIAPGLGNEDARLREVDQLSEQVP